jgi:NodT family efflux transporter outer membrane factor (OMF) lipoprotein
MRTRTEARLCAVLLATASCAVGPDYLGPEDAQAPEWSAELRSGLSGESPAAEQLASWWSAFDDPTLGELIALAVQNNPDAEEARARIREARARRRVEQAGLLPTIVAASNVRRVRSSEQVGNGETTSLYTPGFDASWEIDLFGGQRRSIEAAGADLAATEEDLRDVLVTLAGEVASGYVDLRSFQVRLGLAEASLATQADTFDIARWRAEAGLTTVLDVEQARTILEQTRAAIPQLRTAVEQAGNRLDILLGETPGSLDALVEEPRPIPVAPLDVAIGVPAETLLRRPDVRRAERQLAAENARVGVATAFAYPSLSLVGSIGLEALHSGDVFDAASNAAAYASTLAWTVFDAGAIRGTIDAQQAVYEQAQARYRTTLLAALQEVEDALVAFAEEQDRRQALAEASAAADRALELSRQLYSAGLTDFQDVLESERSSLLLQDQLAASEATVSSNAISLYKALGGGWAPGPSS